MTDRFTNHPPEHEPARSDRRAEDDSLDALMLEALRRPVPGPDQTRRIMGRLGYMRVPPQVARQQRRKRWFGRLVVATISLFAIGLGIQVYNNSTQVRRPTGPTIPAALSQDLREERDRLSDAMDLFRGLASPDALDPIELAPDGRRPLRERADRDDSSRPHDASRPQPGAPVTAEGDGDSTRPESPMTPAGEWPEPEAPEKERTPDRDIQGARPPSPETGRPVRPSAPATARPRDVRRWI